MQEVIETAKPSPVLPAKQKRLAAEKRAEAADKKGGETARAGPRNYCVKTHKRRAAGGKTITAFAVWAYDAETQKHKQLTQFADTLRDTGSVKKFVESVVAGLNSGTLTREEALAKIAAAKAGSIPE